MKDIWKVKDQKCVVLIEVKGKIYQVDLNKEQMQSLIFILPQLFNDHKIKVIDKELENIYFDNYEKTKPNNSDWQERFDKVFENNSEVMYYEDELKDFISSELQEEREVKVKVVYNQVCEQIAREEREKTLKEIEGIIGLDEFRVGQVYFFKKQLLSKINSLKQK